MTMKIIDREPADKIAFRERCNRAAGSVKGGLLLSMLLRLGMGPPTWSSPDVMPKHPIEPWADDFDDKEAYQALVGLYDRGCVDVATYTVPGSEVGSTAPLVRLSVLRLTSMAQALLRP
jgi:hypothetical protein